VVVVIFSAMVLLFAMALCVREVLMKPTPSIATATAGVLRLSPVIIWSLGRERSAVDLRAVAQPRVLHSPRDVARAEVATAALQGASTSTVAVVGFASQPAQDRHCVRWEAEARALPSGSCRLVSEQQQLVLLRSPSSAVAAKTIALVFEVDELARNAFAAGQLYHAWSAGRSSQPLPPGRYIAVCVDEGCTVATLELGGTSRAALRAEAAQRLLRVAEQAAQGQSLAACWASFHSLTGAYRYPVLPETQARVRELLMAHEAATTPTFDLDRLRTLAQREVCR
jgi:hypothetical protein